MDELLLVDLADPNLGIRPAECLPNQGYGLHNRAHKLDKIIHLYAVLVWNYSKV
jgi:hypothetical protein